MPRIRKDRKHLEVYKKYMVKGEMEYSGLCVCVEKGIIDGELLYLFKPEEGDYDTLVREMKSIFYWGSDDFSFKCRQFTPLRQTIVLFMAAMNGELD